MLADVINAMTDDFYQISQLVLDSPVSVNLKSGTTLKDSELAKTLRVISDNGNGDLIFTILVNDYVDFIESGRRKGAKMPPVEPIIRWCKKKGIPSDNNTVWLIRRAISRDGIRPRKIMEEILDNISKAITDKWLDEIYNSIVESLNKWFE